MLGKSLTNVSLVVTFFLLILNAIYWLPPVKTIIRFENVPPFSTYFVNDELNDRASNFRRFNTSPELFAVSAYWEQNYKVVRIFMLKQSNSEPRIQCSFGYNVGPSSKVDSSTDCEGHEYGFTEWNEFEATLRGFCICCFAPDSKPAIAYTTLYLSLGGDTLQGVPSVSLPIYRSLPDPTQRGQFPYKFAVCIAPLFQMSQFSVTFLVEFLEMHRAMGAELFLVYLSAPPTKEVKLVLDSYQTQASLGQSGNFQVIAIPWYLSPSMNPNATWAHTQIIAYNDCLYRFGHTAEYFMMTDLDELLVPDPRFGYSWSSMFNGLHAASGQYTTIACSCLRRMWFEPQTQKNKLSPFYAERITALTPNFNCTRKCIVRSGMVKLFHVHEPLLPLRFYKSDDIFIVLHYRRCSDNCAPLPDEVAQYRYIWPLREGIQVDIDRRLSYIKRLRL